MAWMELSFATTPEAVDWVRTVLAAIDYPDGIIVEPADTASVDLFQPGEQNPAMSDWGFIVSLYLPQDGSAQGRAEKIVQRLSALRRTGEISEFMQTIVTEKPAIADRPLIRQIGDRWIILSPDADYSPQSADQVLLRLGRKLAFGSGLHPTTTLCLRLLERHVQPCMNALDLGSGTGILSVAIAKLGATVLALDHDQAAVAATQDTVNCNQVGQQVTVKLGSLGKGSEMGHWLGEASIDSGVAIDPWLGFDLIVANILGRMQVALASDFQQALQTASSPLASSDFASSQTGLLITSGFTTDYEAEVVAAMERVGFEVIDRITEQDWIAIAFQ